MQKEETPVEYKDKLLLVFVGEFWSDNPIYENWIEGRIEFRKWEDDHGNDMIKYCTKKSDEWFAFEEKYNLKWLAVSELQEFKKTVQEKFRRKPKSGE